MEKICAHCGKAFHVKPSHYNLRMNCSEECMSQYYKTKLVGSANPNYKNAGKKICIRCGKEYKSYNKSRIYCSQQCYKSDEKTIARLRGMAKEAGIKAGSVGNRQGDKDKNHDLIVSAIIEDGATVLDTSAIGRGFPDLIAGKNGVNYLIEIKNPKTSYGRAGLNRLQQYFHRDWKAPISIVYTIEDALKVINAR